MLDASPSDENSTEFSKHPRNDPTTRVGPRSRIPSLSSRIPGSEDHYPLVTLPIAKARGFSGYPELQESVPGQCPGIYA